MQLNALSRLQKYMEKSEKEAIINSYFLIPSSSENNLIYLLSSEWGK